MTAIRHTFAREIEVVVGEEKFSYTLTSEQIGESRWRFTTSGLDKVEAAIKKLSAPTREVVAGVVRGTTR